MFKKTDENVAGYVDADWVYYQLDHMSYAGFCV
jgi:hypothetical protein